MRVLDCSGSGSDSGVIAGSDWVTADEAKPAVANMILGRSMSTALDDAVRRSIQNGIVYAIAAGNDNQLACNDSPGRTALPPHGDGHASRIVHKPARQRRL